MVGPRLVELRQTGGSESSHQNSEGKCSVKKKMGHHIFFKEIAWYKICKSCMCL